MVNLPTKTLGDAVEDYKLTETELWAIKHIINGEEADFATYVERNFRAETLRRIMLGLPLDNFPTGLKLTGIGIRLKNANISGRLNLEHTSLDDGGDLPRLSLEQCDIKDGINLKSARLRRLCLKNARTSEVLADYVHIGGLLDIRGLSPHPHSGRPGTGHNPQPLCRISLCGARIEDGIEAGGAHLVAPPYDPNYVKYSARSTYALDMPEAHVNGDIRLFPNFTACGGVNINGAVIKGSFHAHGAHFTHAQLFGLDASGAKIAGNLALDSRITTDEERLQARQRNTRKPPTEQFVCDGELNLNNVSVGEDLRLFGACIIGERGCISAEHITVKGDAYFSAFDDALDDTSETTQDFGSYKPEVFKFYCLNKIDLRGAIIGGDLSFRGAELGGSLDISTSQIGGHLLFSPHTHNERRKSNQTQVKGLQKRFHARGRIKLEGTHVKGNMSFQGASLEGELFAHGLIVNGYANFSPYETDGNTHVTWRFTALRKVVMDSSIISQKFDLSGAQMDGEFLAPNIQVGGKLLMCAFAPKAPDDEICWFDAQKRVNLSGAKVQGDFDLTGARLRRGLRFRGGQVSSALIIDIFNAENASTKPKDKVSIDLFNAHANILSDQHFTNEKRLGYGTAYFLRLEGFSYGRFPHYRDSESLSESERDRRDALHQRLGATLKKTLKEGTDFSLSDWLNVRLEWLNCQYRELLPSRKNYNPDPYNSLYKFYKKMGAQEIADKVLIYKLETERKIKTHNVRILNLRRRFINILLYFFEIMFGYGLKADRAAWSLLTYAAIVCSVIWFVDNPISVSVTPAYRDIASINLTSPPNRWPLDISYKADAEPGRVVYKDGVESTDIKNKSCKPDRSLYRSFTYMAETIVPYFDVNERDSCDFSKESRSWWGWFRVLAALLGWFITSLTILTWTGVFRRNVEP